MKLFFTALTIALIAAMANANEYGSNYQLQGTSSSADTSSAGGASAGANTPDAHAHSGAAPSTYGSNNNIPYSPANVRGNSITSSISYPNNKGEILIHRPAAIIVKRPPTKVLVNHPPLVVKPAPVVLHKPPAVVVRKVYVKHHPRPVKVEPVYVNVVKPPAEKYFVNVNPHQQYKNQAQYGAAHLAPSVPSSYAHAPSSYSSAPASSASSSSASGGLAAVDSAAHNAGYELMPGNSGLGAYTGVSHQGSYQTPSGYSSPNSYAAPGYAAPQYGAQATY